MLRDAYWQAVRQWVVISDEAEGGLHWTKSAIDTATVELVAFSKAAIQSVSLIRGYGSKWPIPPQYLERVIYPLARSLRGSS